MGKVIAEYEDFMAVADAIRAKAGTTEQLAFPGDFVRVIRNLTCIPSGRASSVLVINGFTSSAVGVLSES